MDSEQITIRIASGNPCAGVEIKGSDGTIQKKHVSMQELITKISSMNKVSTGLIPPNTRIFEGDLTDYNIVLEYPPKVRKFFLTIPAQRAEVGRENYKPSELDMPYPFMVFIFQVKDFKVVRSFAFSNNKRVIDLDDMLYRFPFGNTYEDGHICWGENKIIDEIRSPNHLLGLIEMFFSSPYNGDLAHSNSVNSSIGCERDFWAVTKYLNGKPSFPTEALVGSGFSVGAALRGTK